MQSRIPEPIPEGLTVFETMRVEADGQIRLWPLHLARLRRGCAAVGFPLDEDAIETAMSGLSGPARVRTSIDQQGKVEVVRADLPPNPAQWQVAISGIGLRSDDPWLQIKTTQRRVYEAARAAMPDGMDEVILLNERGEVCEGTITNLFLRRDGVYLTPPLACGLLPGILRQSLLSSGKAIEAVIMPSDLRAGELFMGNALRGLIPARLVAA